jgi:Fe-S-cluster-containing dehydrogenase component
VRQFLWTDARRVSNAKYKEFKRYQVVKESSSSSNNNNNNNNNDNDNNNNYNTNSSSSSSSYLTSPPCFFTCPTAALAADKAMAVTDRSMT